LGRARRGSVLSVVLTVVLIGVTTHGGPNRAGSTAGKKEYPFGRGNVKWVSTQWLQDNLNDPNLTILDTQPDIQDYCAEHLPGAVYLNEATLRAPKDGLPAQYIPAEAAKLLLRRIGLDNDSPAVVYSGQGAYTQTNGHLTQSMLAYALARLGHNRVYVLDGGLDKWRQEGRLLSQEFPRVAEGRFRPSVRQEYAIDMEQVKKLKDRGDVILLDARSAKYYQGKGPWSRAGHIPGAVNLPWQALMADDNPTLLKGDDEIRKILKDHAVTSDKIIIVSCGIGRESTSEFLLLKWYLGYPDVRLYEGSFAEWADYPQNPTVTGPNPCDRQSQGDHH
jgi:thiosulfate/3-mercaptopyruvate sulfurtransferase